MATHTSGCAIVLKADGTAVGMTRDANVSIDVTYPDISTDDSSGNWVEFDPSCPIRSLTGSASGVASLDSGGNITALWSILSGATAASMVFGADTASKFDFKFSAVITNLSVDKSRGSETTYSFDFQSTGAVTFVAKGS